MVGIIVVGIIVKGFFNSFHGKTEASKSLIFICMTQMVIVCKFLYFLIANFAIKSFAVGMLKVVVEGALPFGHYNSFFSNMFDSSIYFANASSLPGDYPVLIFFLGATTFILSHLLVRCCYGIAVYRQLGFSFNLNMLLMGYYSYMIDVWNPILVLLTWDFSKIGVKKKMYGILMVAGLFFECAHAHEIIILRAFLFIVDHLFIQSGLNYGDKKLEVEVSFCGLAFPKMGSFPFCSLETLHEVAKNVKILECVVRDAAGDVLRRVNGVGLIRHDERGMSQLVTVSHVLEGATEVWFEGHTEKVLETCVVGDSIDPVITMPISSKISGVDLKFLTLNEIPFVSFLFTVGAGKEAAVIKDFSFGKDGDISVVVNLKQGDSGSAILAVLKNGTVRFAGTVSRGTFNDGTGNIASSVITSSSKRSGSPGTPNLYFDVHPDLSSTKLKIDGMIHDNLVENAKAHQEFLDGFKEPREKFGDEHEKWDPGDRNKYKKRIKSFRKERAVQKQMVEKLITASNIDDKTVALLFKAFDEGRIVDYNYQRGQYRPKMGFVGGMIKG